MWIPRASARGISSARGNRIRGDWSPRFSSYVRPHKISYLINMHDLGRNELYDTDISRSSSRGLVLIVYYLIVSQYVFKIYKNQWMLLPVIRNHQCLTVCMQVCFNLYLTYIWHICTYHTLLCINDIAFNIIGNADSSFSTFEDYPHDYYCKMLVSIFLTSEVLSELEAGQRSNENKKFQQVPKQQLRQSRTSFTDQLHDNLVSFKQCVQCRVKSAVLFAVKTWFEHRWNTHISNYTSWHII